MTKEEIIRKPAVAGVFYPADRAELEEVVDDCLKLGAKRAEGSRGTLRAIIAPHAGYDYSGFVAGTAFAALESAADKMKRVVMIGPSHRVWFEGIALPQVKAFQTPLGDVQIDTDSVEKLAKLRFVKIVDAPHEKEHSLEVHLPFLQKALKEFSIVPLVVGEASGEQVSEALDALECGEDTIIVVSSDLSHYLSNVHARELDAETSSAIESLSPSDIPPNGACGVVPIQGVLLSARKHHWRAKTLHLANSSEAFGETEKVVGYGAYGFFAS